MRTEVIPVVVGALGTVKKESKHQESVREGYCYRDPKITACWNLHKSSAGVGA